MKKQGRGILEENSVTADVRITALSGTAYY
jgi:hypothetical protein